MNADLTNLSGKELSTEEIHLEEEEEEDAETKMADVVRKLLLSPTYSLPLIDFIDENCSMFDNFEESKPDYAIVGDPYMLL